MMKRCIILCLMLCLLAGCTAAPETPAGQSSVGQSEFQAGQQVTDPPASDGAVPTVSADTLLRECQFLLTGDVTAVGEDHFTFTVAIVEKGSLSQKEITVEIDQKEGFTLQKGRCMLALKKSGEKFSLSHGAAGYLLPDKDFAIYTNTLEGINAISFDTAALPSQIALLEES